MMSDATPMNDEELRTFAAFMVKAHDPAHQNGNMYERCALCNYTRHPCDCYDMAAAVLRLLGTVLVAPAEVDEQPDEDASDD